MRLQILLQPRNFFYKKKQKRRIFHTFKQKYKQSLIFGGSGIFLLQPIFLTSLQIFRFKLFLKRASKKPEYTKRFVWFKAFPHLPLTRKPNGIRMGKGKGKLECWYTIVSAGIVLIEFKNLTKGRTNHFTKQITHRLGIKTKSIFSVNDFQLNCPFKNSGKFFFRTFW